MTLNFQFLSLYQAFLSSIQCQEMPFPARRFGVTQSSTQQWELGRGKYFLSSGELLHRGISKQ